jgi:hypothetical protein
MSSRIGLIAVSVAAAIAVAATLVVLPAADQSVPGVPSPLTTPAGIGAASTRLPIAPAAATIAGHVTHSASFRRALRKRRLEPISRLP